MASKIAAEVLKDNAKLRGLHSKESIKAILEKIYADIFIFKLLIVK